MAETRVFAQQLGGFGELTLVVLDPRAHAELVHGWVTQPRNRFWGMSSYTPGDVREIYEFVEGLSTHHAYLILLDATPIGLLQTYEVEHDPLAEHYDVLPGDVGVHVLLAPGGRASSRLVAGIRHGLLGFVFRDPTHKRIVVEPDVDNRAALLRLRLSGFTFGPELDLADKRAQLAFLPRERFESSDGETAGPVERARSCQSR